MLTSLVVIPTKENTRILALSSTSREKKPLASVVVAFVVPFICTDTSANGSPASSVTVPVIVRNTGASGSLIKSSLFSEIIKMPDSSTKRYFSFVADIISFITRETGVCLTLTEKMRPSGIISLQNVNRYLVSFSISLKTLVSFTPVSERFTFTSWEYPPALTDIAQTNSRIEVSFMMLSSFVSDRFVKLHLQA